MNFYISLTRKNRQFRSFVYKILEYKARKDYKLIAPYLKRMDKVLDIGAGTCNLCNMFNKKGFKTTALDVVDLSLIKGVKPVLFNGRTMPFKNKEFDVALMVTVLHHIKDQKSVLLEAKRVAKKVIVIEDIYRSQLERYMVLAWDSLVNFEFIGHPHTNRDDKDWKNYFEELGYRIVLSEIDLFRPPIPLQGIYVLSSTR